MGASDSKGGDLWTMWCPRPTPSSGSGRKNIISGRKPHNISEQDRRMDIQIPCIPVASKTETHIRTTLETKKAIGTSSKNEKLEKRSESFDLYPLRNVQFLARSDSRKDLVADAKNRGPRTQEHIAPSMGDLMPGWSEREQKLVEKILRDIPGIDRKSNSERLVWTRI